LRRISILELVDQYLDYVARAGALRLELAADYLVMAAWLAYLKSLLLLPRDPAMQPGPEELALRLQLRLQRLGAMREAGARLMARDRLGRDVLRAARPEDRDRPSPALEGRSVCADPGLWSGAASQSPGRSHGPRKAGDDARGGAGADFGDAGNEPGMARLARVSAASTLDSLEARQLARSALASSFLAVLELAKQGLVDLVQEECFGPLLVRPR
jgi:segregation and condensation protein A